MRCLKKVWLKIWSKVKDLFGKRKMEIDETINKWFDETHKNFLERGAVNKFLLSVFLAAKNYILSSLLLEPLTK